jgi:hypothetical protein
MKSVLGLVVAVALAGGCSGATVVTRSSSTDAKKLRRETVRITHRKGSLAVSPSSTTAGAWGRHIARAVIDLKDLGLWSRLTRHLDGGPRLRPLPGRSNVPDDGHLADSLYRARADGGRYCRVTFYPAAMQDDLARQRFYYRRGFLRARPPTMTEFWTMILAHELTHCRDQRRGERVALAVEARVLELLRRT